MWTVSVRVRVSASVKNVVWKRSTRLQFQIQIQKFNCKTWACSFTLSPFLLNSKSKSELSSAAGAENRQRFIALNRSDHSKKTWCRNSILEYWRLGIWYWKLNSKFTRILEFWNCPSPFHFFILMTISIYLKEKIKIKCPQSTLDTLRPKPTLPIFNHHVWIIAIWFRIPSSHFSPIFLHWSFVMDIFLFSSRVLQL